MTANDQDIRQAAEELERYIQESPAFQVRHVHGLNPSPPPPYAFALSSGTVFVPANFTALRDQAERSDQAVLTETERIDAAVPEALKAKLMTEQQEPPTPDEPDLRNPRAIWTAFLDKAMDSLCKSDGELHQILKGSPINMTVLLQAIQRIFQNAREWRAAITMAVVQVIAVLLLRFSAYLICRLKGYSDADAPAS